MNNPYYRLKIHGQYIWKCLYCKFDTFEPGAVDRHCRVAHRSSKLPGYDIDLVTWIVQQHNNPLVGKKVALCLLTWNTLDASMKAAQSLKEEVIRLCKLGVQAVPIWYDNGSTDGTQEQVYDLLVEDQEFSTVRVYLDKQNNGQCIARNWMINEALSCRCDYIFMFDGDIELVPYSVYSLTMYLHKNGYRLGDASSVASIGLYSGNCTHEEDDLAQDCREIAPWMVTLQPDQAWTQYGVFSRSVFDSGVRFDESGPFAGPGWGFEDDDLFLQMAQRGMLSANTKFFRFAHRPRNSSVRNLGQSLAAKVLKERVDYLKKKWAHCPIAAAKVNKFVPNVPVGI